MDLRDQAASALLALAGLIHLLPVAGALGERRLEALYGVSMGGPVVVLLMRHRAVQLGILGVLLLGAAWRPALRTAAVAAGLASVASFLVLAAMDEESGKTLRRVVIADWIAAACLVLAQVLRRA